MPQCSRGEQPHDQDDDRHPCQVERKPPPDHPSQRDVARPVDHRVAGRRDRQHEPRLEASVAPRAGDSGSTPAARAIEMTTGTTPSHGLRQPGLEREDAEREAAAIPGARRPNRSAPPPSRRARSRYSGLSSPTASATTPGKTQSAIVPPKATATDRCPRVQGPRVSRSRRMSSAPAGSSRTPANAMALRKSRETGRARTRRAHRSSSR
jgi:hypothetical protein